MFYNNKLLLMHFLKQPFNAGDIYIAYASLLLGTYLLHPAKKMKINNVTVVIVRFE